VKSFARRYRWVLAGLALAAVLVLVLAPLASDNPDGLNRVSEDQGFADKADDPAFEILPGYSIPGVDRGRAGVILAGLAGVAIVFLLPMGLGYMARRSRRDAKP